MFRAANRCRRMICRVTIDEGAKRALIVRRIDDDAAKRHLFLCLDECIS